MPSSQSQPSPTVAHNKNKRHLDRPFVFINMAMTADGKIATANRAVSSFGSERDQEHLYELRATADAVMAGARTIDSNEIKLGPGGKRFRQLRLRHGLHEFNLRVVVSGSGTIGPESAIFRHRFSPIIVLTSERISTKRLKLLRTLSDDVHVSGKEQVDFRLALYHLRTKWKIQRLLCEGGAALNAALLDAGLLDELHLTVCPKLFGGRTAPAIADGLGARFLRDATKLELGSAKRVGDELFLVYRVEHRNAASHRAVTTVRPAF